MNKILIYGIKNNSIADEIGLVKGDYIISINDEEIIDILDYKYHMADEYIEIEILHKSGEVEIYEIEKDLNEDLGIEFESELIDKPHSCRNNCIFCFMGQLPPNVRNTLIFKDDDYRLSFFSGNYITLTNMKETDIDRIIKYHLSPVNISVHATDEEVRCMMLNNRFAGKVLKYIDKLYKAKIRMNTQIVLCKNINDGLILEKTLSDLSKYTPYIQSICIVPVGLTKYRDDKYKLEAIGKEDSINTIEIVTKYQKQFKKKYGKSLVFLADEFYFKANMDIPDYYEYEDFPQLENGVGTTAIFEHEYLAQLKKLKKSDINKTVTLITGKITEEYISKKAKTLEMLYNGLKVNVLAIKNDFFGENIIVTGLVTGQDIIKQVNEFKKSSNIGDYIVIPDVMLKEDNDIFLDDTLLTDIVKSLETKVVISDTSAKGFIDTILLDNKHMKNCDIYRYKSKKTKNKYEM